MSVANLIQIKEKLNLCNIWRIKHPKERRFTCRKYHGTGFFQRRIWIVFLVSNILPDSTTQTNMLAYFFSRSLSIVYENLTIRLFPAGIYLLKVNNRNTRTRFEICSKLTIKTPERR